MEIDFNQPVKVHFIGIGGISMSGLAEILLGKGFTITGSDSQLSPMTKRLTHLGATVYLGQHADHITPDIGYIIYTAAIKADNPEWLQAQKMNIQLIDRATLLAQVMNQYPINIAVAGTHGKTTTTSMIAHVLDACGLDPTVSVGGILKLIGGNIKVGHSDYFVTEACEYANSFLTMTPYIGIILNAEEDHMDFFKDRAAIYQSFSNYMHNIQSDGYCIIHQQVLDDLTHFPLPTCKVVTYGQDRSDFCAKNITYDTHGNGCFDLFYQGAYQMSITLSTPGAHNISNALAALALAHTLQLDPIPTSLGLKQFAGTDRRFEYKGDLMGVTIIDDYAHHPTEIEATIAAARRMVKGRLFIVFQPHTYTRTDAFLEGFAQTLAKADALIIMDIYAAREHNVSGIHAKDLVQAIAKYNEQVVYCKDFDDAAYYLLKNLCSDDLLITMGAGDVFLIGEDLLNG